MDRTIDWSALERLRRTFLEEGAARRDYWHSRADLDSYDRTFAQRIAWKWDHVLAELARLGWSPPHGIVMDWGCGSGIAGRRFVGRFGPESVGGLVLRDRSRLAVEFAAEKARQALPNLKVACDAKGSDPPATLLASHVITELRKPQLDALVALAARVTAVIWVEPGTFEAGRALIGVRERLRGEFRIIAPCTHQNACGMIAPGNERHWCHHFAESPPEVFMDGDWARFAKTAGVDLRSLPLSYLVLDKRPPPALPPVLVALDPVVGDAVRIIGRPRIQKAHALIFGCDRAGAGDRRLAKRLFPEEYREFKRDEFDSLRRWECAGDEVVRLAPI